MNRRQLLTLAAAVPLAAALPPQAKADDGYLLVTGDFGPELMVPLGRPGGGVGGPSAQIAMLDQDRRLHLE